MGRKAIPVNPKKCRACQAVMLRKRINGRLEDRGVYSRRKYCNRVCMGIAARSSTPSRESLLRLARKYRGSSCEHCGTSRKLSIHHKDKDWTNNDPSNLQTLCSRCHMLLHHADGDIHTPRERPPCRVCGRPSVRVDLCGKHRQRKRLYGDPCLTKKRSGSTWTLTREP